MPCCNKNRGDRRKPGFGEGLWWSEEVLAVGHGGGGGGCGGGGGHWGPGKPKDVPEPEVDESEPTTATEEAETVPEPTAPVVVDIPDTQPSKPSGGYNTFDNRDCDNDRLVLIPFERKKKCFCRCSLTFLVMVSGFLFGYDTGVVSGSMLLIQPYFHLSMLWAQVIVSATVGTAALTSSVAEFVADFVGRKAVIGTAAVLFTTGAIVMGEAETVLVIIVGRIIVGFAMGLSTVVVVLYVKESALASRLKWLLGWLQLMYTIGNMVANFLTMVLHYIGDSTVWQYLLGFGAIPSILQFIAIMLLPESPRWLMECDDEEGARESLILLRGTDQIQDELEVIRLDVEEERNELDKDDSDDTWDILGDIMEEVGDELLSDSDEDATNPSSSKDKQKDGLNSDLKKDREPKQQDSNKGDSNDPADKGNGEEKGNAVDNLLGKSKSGRKGQDESQEKKDGGSQNGSGGNNENASKSGSNSNSGGKSNADSNSGGKNSDGNSNASGLNSDGNNSNAGGLNSDGNSNASGQNSDGNSISGGKSNAASNSDGKNSDGNSNAGGLNSDGNSNSGGNSDGKSNAGGQNSDGNSNAGGLNSDGNSNSGGKSNSASNSDGNAGGQNSDGNSNAASNSDGKSNAGGQNSDGNSNAGGLNSDGNSNSGGKSKAASNSDGKRNAGGQNSDGNSNASGQNSDGNSNASGQNSDGNSKAGGQNSDGNSISGGKSNAVSNSDGESNAGAQNSDGNGNTGSKSNAASNSDSSNSGGLNSDGISNSGGKNTSGGNGNSGGNNGDSTKPNSGKSVNSPNGSGNNGKNSQSNNGGYGNAAGLTEGNGNEHPENDRNKDGGNQSSPGGNNSKGSTSKSGNDSNTTGSSSGSGKLGGKQNEKKSKKSKQNKKQKKVVNRKDYEKLEGGVVPKGSMSSKPPIIRILLKPKVRQSAMNVSFLHLFQQLSGISCIILYGGSMIVLSGLPTNLSLGLLNIPNILYVVATYLSNKFEPMKDDRRQLLLSSFIGVFFGMALIATGYQLLELYPRPVSVFENNSLVGLPYEDIYFGYCNHTYFQTCAMCTYTEFCGFCYTNWWDGSCLPTDLNNSLKSYVGRCKHSHTADPYYKFIHGDCPNDFGWFVVVGMVVFVLAYAPGLGQITQRENSQRCPVWARKTSNSIARSINWGANLLISMTFLLLMMAMTKYGTCWMFTGLCLIGVIYTAILLPDE